MGGFISLNISLWGWSQILLSGKHIAAGTSLEGLHLSGLWGSPVQGSLVSMHRLAKMQLDTQSFCSESCALA